MSDGPGALMVAAQADREAAASTLPDDGSHTSYMQYEAIMSGRADDWPVVQAAIRRRITAALLNAAGGGRE
jgi:hypothetical protein